MARNILLIILIGMCGLAGALVPPHPKYQNIPSAWEPTRIEALRGAQAGGQGSGQASEVPGTSRILPQNILALRVQFSDVSFIQQASYPDFLPHDTAFFERWMLHLQDFFADASHGRYIMNYHVYPDVFTLPRPMSYYGADTSERIDAQLPQILPDLMPLCDDLIDFTQYQGVIIFHAGAGQESDIDGNRPEQIWSTFLTRKVLQAAFDPDNDDYPGFATGDGAILTNVVIVPEHEFQDYFPLPPDENASAYLFSIYGVLAHQFAHILGLPTLFDNDSSNGRSQGIGNWGLMGTGVWNASGYVPAQLSAWCRYYLGWEDVIEIDSDAEDLSIDHFLDHRPGALRLYKIPITSREYFLIENRQQNPDGSMDPYSNQPSYTFKLLPEGQQEYYENYPLLPYFNFMTNRYISSEWDFFLPGYGMSPFTDGSGILIWHIDENIIAENFTENFDRNRINGNAYHKGVDLEEADGFQHLDTAVYDINKWGGPDDSFRAGNNDYFGDSTYQGLTWLPTAESYYGGIPLEIYNINASANTMSFSVRFAWRLDAGYSGVNTLPAAAIDFDGDGTKEVFYPMPDGKLSLFKDDLMADGFPQFRQDIPKLYTWDSEDLYIPMQVQQVARLNRMNSNGHQYVMNLNGWIWDTHPVDTGTELILALKQSGQEVTDILRFNKATASISQTITTLPDTLSTNLAVFRNNLYAITKPDTYKLFRCDLVSSDGILLELPVPADSTIVGLFMAPITLGSNAGNLIVQCTNSLWVFDEALSLLPGFPVSFDPGSTAPLTITDLDQNGTLDMFIATPYSVYVYDYAGSLMNPPSLNLGADDGSMISSGAVALDLDGDGKLEIAGNFSFNRLVVWEDNYRLKSTFPVSFAQRSRYLPFVAPGADNAHYLWSATDNGSIYRKKLDAYNPATVDHAWHCEYANLQRTASRERGDLPNQYQSEKAFVPSELYIFPNPLKSIYAQNIRLSVMPTRDLEVELGIYDISGTLVHHQKAQAMAYLRNLEIFNIPAAKLSSGIYIAVIKGGGETHRIKFGVEK